jgi:hypothetical protein
MKQNSKFRAALLWDESFLWGLMAYRALKSHGLPFELLRAVDIREKDLEKHSLLFVPGGWASQKKKTLGDKGIDEIRRFVDKGGNYLGFCGGAGLATQDGIGLLDIARKPTKERVPSFNGRIELDISEHPIWKGLDHTPGALPVFHAWWPSQFLIKDAGIKVVARYGNALPDSFSSDVNVGDANDPGRWPELENRYGINLNPARLKGEPAVVEGSFGKGRALLSLIHFDTPNDENGALVLMNLLDYLGLKGLPDLEPRTSLPSHDRHRKDEKQIGPIPGLLSEMEMAVTGLIDLGIRNFLWFRRDSMLLQWRRGVRGMEYCTLYVLVKELCERLRESSNGGPGDQEKEALLEIKELLLPFIERAKQLLILERFAMQQSQITYDRCDVPEIKNLRMELFSDSKSYGGLFKKLIDKVDSLLYGLLPHKRGFHEQE